VLLLAIVAFGVPLALSLSARVSAEVRSQARAGSFAHHLLDPRTGAPVWSGLIGATALGGCALEAETLSKMALLLGPDGAREVLAERGGVIIRWSH
jgi:thiamine biosynthesis lipoprotein ApbE